MPRPQRRLTPRRRHDAPTGTLLAATYYLAEADRFENMAARYTPGGDPYLVADAETVGTCRGRAITMRRMAAEAGNTPATAQQARLYTARTT